MQSSLQEQPLAAGPGAPGRAMPLGTSRRIASWFVAWPSLAFTQHADPRIVVVPGADVVVDLCAHVTGGLLVRCMREQYGILGISLTNAPSPDDAGSAPAPGVDQVDFGYYLSPTSHTYHVLRDCTIVLAMETRADKRHLRASLRCLAHAFQARRSPTSATLVIDTASARAIMPADTDLLQRSLEWTPLQLTALDGSDNDDYDADADFARTLDMTLSPRLATYGLVARVRAYFADDVIPVYVLDIASDSMLSNAQFTAAETGTRLRPVFGLDRTLMYDAYRRGDFTQAHALLRDRVARRARTRPVAAMSPSSSSSSSSSEFNSNEEDSNESGETVLADLDLLDLADDAADSALVYGTGPSDAVRSIVLDLGVLKSDPAIRPFTTRATQNAVLLGRAPNPSAADVYGCLTNSYERPHARRLPPVFDLEQYALNAAHSPSLALSELANWDEFLGLAGAERHASHVGRIARMTRSDVQDWVPISREMYERRKHACARAVPSTADTWRRAHQNSAAFTSYVNTAMRGAGTLEIDAGTGNRGVVAARDLAAGDEFASLSCFAYVPHTVCQLSTCDFCGLPLHAGAAAAASLQVDDVSNTVRASYVASDDAAVVFLSRADGQRQTPAKLPARDRSVSSQQPYGACLECKHVVVCSLACWDSIKERHFDAREVRPGSARSECMIYASGLLARSVDAVISSAGLHAAARDPSIAEETAGALYTSLRLALRTTIAALAEPADDSIWPLLLSDEGAMTPDESASICFTASVVCGLLLDPVATQQLPITAQIELMQDVTATCARLDRNAISDVQVRCISPAVAMFNHACDANVDVVTAPAVAPAVAPTFTCTALRPIKKGEPLTIRYFYYDVAENGEALATVSRTRSGVDVRKTELMRGWSFDCGCALCKRQEYEWIQRDLEDYV